MSYRVSAYLEYRLRKAESPARTQVSDARRFRMENGGADADERDRHEDEREIWRYRKQDQTDQR